MEIDYDFERKEKLRKAINELDNAINDMGVSIELIGKGFLTLHPYLLNQLMLGLTYTCANSTRQIDPRINPKFQELSKEIWL